jgi:hypothetical protein
MKLGESFLDKMVERKEFKASDGRKLREREEQRLLRKLHQAAVTFGEFHRDSCQPVKVEQVVRCGLVEQVSREGGEWSHFDV